MLWHTVQSETMQSVCNNNQSEIKPSKKSLSFDMHATNNSAH